MKHFHFTSRNDSVVIVTSPEMKEKTSRKKKRNSTIDLINRQALECGLSYGKYRAELAKGKTYEEILVEKAAPVAPDLPDYIGKTFNVGG